MFLINYDIINYAFLFFIYLILFFLCLKKEDVKLNYFYLRLKNYLIKQDDLKIIIEIIKRYNIKN